MALEDTHCAIVEPGAAVEPATRGTADRTSGESVARLSSTPCRGAAAAGLPRLFAETRRRRTVVDGDLSIESIAYDDLRGAAAARWLPYRIVISKWTGIATTSTDSRQDY